MSTNTQRSSSGNRGGKRYRGRSGNGRGNDRSSSNFKRTPKPAPKKLTLWEKIVSFFSGGAAAEASPAPAPARSQSEPRFESAPRQDQAPKSEPREPRKREARKPELVAVTSPRIYVGNLSFDATESDLTELFGGIGLVQNVEVVFNRHTQRSKGFGFVQMQTVEEAQRAVSELHDKEYMGRKLVVSGAKALDERSASRAAAADEPTVAEAADVTPEVTDSAADETPTQQPEQ